VAVGETSERDQRFPPARSRSIRDRGALPDDDGAWLQSREPDSDAERARSGGGIDVDARQEPAAGDRPERPASGAGGDGRPLLGVRGVSVAFGGLQALDAVSLDVREGEVLGLIGPNGAGKTTLFNVVCGFVRPSAGDITWRGEPLRRIRPNRLAGLGIARTLQSLGLFPNQSVLANVMVGADRHARAGFTAAFLGLPASDRDERALRGRAMATLTELGIADAAPRIPGTLPYGVQKRVALARALVAEPRLLLLDEPASGLSETEMGEMGDLIRALRGRMSVMLVEHHMDLVMAVCERIAVLDFGRLIATGTPDDVSTDPAVLDAYLGQTVAEVGAGNADAGNADAGDAGSAAGVEADPA
jgi:branched-chain amino acid transport system ATP-binding protein